MAERQSRVRHKISGDIFISIDRVMENAMVYKEPFNKELNRVMFHGVLHLCGYKDKSQRDIVIMRKKEAFYLELYNRP